MSRSHVEISHTSIAHNISELRRMVGPGRHLAAVVKANAYGHGAAGVARIALAHGADWLAVDSVEEGLQLRSAGLDQVPILVMGFAPPEQAVLAVKGSLRLTVTRADVVSSLSKEAVSAGHDLALHIKAETGTQRRGVQGRELLDLARLIDELPGVFLEGLTTHFANIEDTTDHSYARSQLKAFHQAYELLKQAGLQVPIRHAACSAAIVLFGQTHFELARAGISLYGMWSSRETFVSAQAGGSEPVTLRPALTWKTRIAEIKDVPAGAFVGYGCSWRTTRPSRIAILPIGYYDGYDRGLSNVAHVLVRGQRAPVRGRVCMNMSMVDVSDISGARNDDEVVLLGGQGDENISAEQMASWLGTIHYEVVTRIRAGLPRVYV